MHNDNEHRAECAETAVRAYAAVKEHNATDCCDFSSEDAQERLTDMLADLRHWARAGGLDFADAVRTSEMHFEAEVDEEGGDADGPPAPSGAVEDELAAIAAQAPPQAWAQVCEAQRLAAAAPDLLLAARCALADIQGFLFDADVDPADPAKADIPAVRTVNELQAAIAKAEGGDA
jgi:hypothetical protein